MSEAPIALFVYKRPDHVRWTLESLTNCPEFGASALYVFCDGPKSEKDRPAVQRAREVARSLAGPRAVFLESEVNRGLANSIVTGVTRVLAEHERIVVVEDDLIVAPQFLTFLNLALERYAKEPKVMQVSGHMFDVPEFTTRREALFLPLTTSWGWATWARAWTAFDPVASGWEALRVDRALRKRFNIGGSIDYAKMLCSQAEGMLDSWAIRWYWSVFRREGVVVFPPQTLVSNAGFNSTGTHGWRVARRLLGHDPSFPESGCPTFPTTIAVLPTDVAAIKTSLQRQRLYSHWLAPPIWALRRALRRATKLRSP
jgi:hypothetical protein